MTTPAPTLQELPPEKGSILELNSIGDEAFNGKLVEFLKKDKEEGKIWVCFLDDEDKSLRVKVKCCRRPPIQPLALRKMLSSLCSKLRVGLRHGNDLAAWGRDEARIKSILKKDPCCSQAHELMAYVTVNKEYRSNEGLRKEADEATAKHFRRALGTLYAYKDIIQNPDEYTTQIEIQIAHYLTVAGRYKSAVRTDKKSQGRDAVANMDIFATMQSDLSLGCAIFEKAEKLDWGNQQKGKLHMESASHFLKVLERASGNPAKIEKHRELQRCVHVAEGKIHDLCKSFANLQSRNK